MLYHLVKYHDITKYHDMYNNEDYGATYTYNHHIVTVGQYQGTLISCHTVNITCYTLLVYTNVYNKISILYAAK